MKRLQFVLHYMEVKIRRGHNETHVTKLDNNERNAMNGGIFKSVSNKLQT